jgi:hypothetical protein
MNNQNGNITLALIILLVLIGGIGGYITFDWMEQKKKIANLEELRKIKSTDGVIENSLTFEFATVSTTIFFEHEGEYKTDSRIYTDEVHMFYTTDYSFTFGYNLDSWDWCTKVINEELGEIQVTAPPIEWTNSNKVITPSSYGKPIAKIHYPEVTPMVQAEVTEKLSKMLEDKAQSYLQSKHLKSSVEQALSKFLQDTINAGYEKSNPISKVIISNTCS